MGKLTTYWKCFGRRYFGFSHEYYIPATFDILPSALKLWTGGGGVLGSRFAGYVPLASL